MADKRPSAIIRYEPGSTDYLYVPVTVSGQPAADVPSVIEFAFVATGQPLDPDEVDWYTAEVDADGLHAKLNIGDYGGASDPGPGKYDLYVRLTATPVRPVRKAGRVTIL